MNLTAENLIVYCPYLLAAWFACGCVVRVAFSFSLTPRTDAPEEPLRPAEILAGLIKFLGVSLFCLSLITGIGLVLFENVGAWRFFSLVIFGVALIDFLLMIIAYRKQVVLPPKLGPALVIFLLGLGLAGGVAFLRSAPGPAKLALNCVYPVRGEWIVVVGGRLPFQNPHYNHPPEQNGAIDLVRKGGQSVGQPVFAPVAGRVTRAIGDRFPGDVNAEGNVIVITTEDGTEVWLAHLEANTLRVTVGDSVGPGQEIARCGESGNAERGHVHLHAQKEGRAVTLTFGEKRRYLVRNDRVRNESLPALSD